MPVTRKGTSPEGKRHAGENWATGAIAPFCKAHTHWREVPFWSGSGGPRTEVKAWASRPSLSAAAELYCSEPGEGRGNRELFLLCSRCVCDMPAWSSWALSKFLLCRAPKSLPSLS